MTSVSRGRWLWVQRSDEVMGTEGGKGSVPVTSCPSPHYFFFILTAQLPVDRLATRSDR
jgi:hypothetical protein